MQYDKKFVRHRADPPYLCNPPGYVPPPPPNRPRQFAADKSNTTLFIGGINNTVSDEELRNLFEYFGRIRYINRSFQSTAFVQFEERRDALMALRQLQGVPVYSCRLRILWGKPAVKNQDDFEVKEGPVPYKGRKHQYLPQPEQQMRGMRQRRGFNNMPRPENYQQRYDGPAANAIWHYVPGHQQTPQQQMGHGFEHRAQPPLRPPLRSPPSPEIAHTSRPSKLNPCANWFNGNPSGKGPVIVSSDMAANPSQQSTHQPTQEIITSSSEGQHTDGSTGRSKSGDSSGRTSPEKETSPKRENSPGPED